MVAHDAGASSIVGTQALPNDPAGERVFRGINTVNFVNKNPVFSAQGWKVSSA